MRENSSKGAQVFTPRALLASLVIVAVITGANMFSNGPPDWDEQPPESRGYTGHAYIFSYAEGLALNFIGVDEVNATDKTGLMHGFFENATQPCDEIDIYWGSNENYTCLEDALEKTFPLIGWNITCTAGTALNTSTREHPFIYRHYNASSIDGRNWIGVAGVWNCTESGRMFTICLSSQDESANPADLEERYIELMSSFFSWSYRRPIRSGRLPDYVTNTVTASLMVLFCVGLTFTFKMERFPNFAHIHYATIGSAVSFYLVRFYRFNSYDTWPFAALVGGLIGMILYVTLVRPIGSKARKWNRYIILTFTSYVIAYSMVSVIGMFNYWTRNAMGAPSTGFRVGGDFRINGLPGIAYIGPLTCIFVVVGFHFFLTKTRFGTSLRATAEDENLAATLGINVYNSHLASWFISGALSALAGSIITLWSGVGLGGSDDLFIKVMAGSVLGGLDNIYGAIFGGIFITMAQDALSDILLLFFGIGVKMWDRLFPMAFLLIVMMLAPQGLTSIGEKQILELRYRIRRLRERIINKTS